VRDVKMFLEGRPTDLARSLRARMEQAATAQEYERAARYRDLISTVEQLQERQRIAAAEGDDADVFGYHYENGMLAVNLFHMRGGKMVDRREFFWEDLPEFAESPEVEPSTEHVETATEYVETATENVGTAALGCPGEQSSPAQLADPIHTLEANPTQVSLGTDGRGRPSPHDQFHLHPGDFFSALLKQ